MIFTSSGDESVPAARVKNPGMAIPVSHHAFRLAEEV
jgi:hypothetical protein